MAERLLPTLQSPTTELEKYLEYYTQLKEPGYAVLITGSWGSGKSHQTKIAIGSDCYYVTLFGLNSAEEVYSSVFAKMSPSKAKAKEIGSFFQELGLEFSGAKLSLGGLASGVVNALIREQVDNEKTIIFDDLERSNIPLKVCLGVINKYVEHHGCRVVVIAHDEKLAEGFLEAKEKIFGHNIRVVPQREAAFDNFIEKYAGEEQRFLSSRKKIIIEIMKDSGCESLRILRRTIEDLCRIYGVLSDEHRANDDALTELTKIFVALSLEVRSGSLSREDILGRNRVTLLHYLSLRTNEGGKPKPPLLVVSDKHPTLNLDNQLINDEIMAAMLFDGSFDSDLIRQSLNNSLSYAMPEELPPWRALMSLDEISDADAERSVQRLRLQFDNREVEDPGEILHIFAFMLLLSRIGMLGCSLDETVTDCRKYLDDLIDQGRMAPIPGGLSRQYDIGRVHGGYAYWVEDGFRTQFQELTQYLIECGERSMRATYPAVAEELLSLMAEDSASFAEKLTISGGSESTYAQLDVLGVIPPKQFVTAFMEAHPVHWQNIGQVLRRRYDSGELTGALQTEACWVIEVIDLLEAVKEGSSPLRRLRIERAVPWEIRTTAAQACP